MTILRIMVLLALLSPPPALGLEVGKDKAKPDRISRTTTEDLYRAFTINNVFNYYSNNGDGSINRYTYNGAFEFPKGSGKTAIFEDGVLWGGFHKGRDVPKVGGSAYRHGLQAGRILTNGTATSDPMADDPSKAEYRIYSVRPDVSPKTAFEAVKEILTSESALLYRDDSITTAQILYYQYLKDWNEWPSKTISDPAGLAPFRDMNGNGTYEPDTDIPGQPGADQTLYYVANDMNSARSTSLAGSPPIGLEMHRTIWGYSHSAALNQMIFVSTLLINKSGAPVDSMFITQWSDADLGDAGDDFVGCDTVRNIGYTYNGKSTDKAYGSQVPAVGYQLLQGPRVPAAGDSALFMQRYRTGFKNLGMASFVLFSGGFAEYADAGIDAEWYRLMNGVAKLGNSFYDPVTHMPTRFCVPGDPVTLQGWIDGMAGLTPQDRRLCFSSGPFTMASGDTQEIVVATLIAQGTDRISSITELKTAGDLLPPYARSGFALLPLSADVRITYPSASLAQVLITTDTRGTGTQSVSALLKNADGIVSQDIILNDAGQQGDAAPGDAIFSAKATVNRLVKPLTLDVTTTDATGSHLWLAAKEAITVAGPVLVTGPEIFSDNINNNGAANPGENIRYGIRVTNQTPFVLNLHVDERRDPPKTIQFAALSPSDSSILDYDPGNIRSYLSADVPDYIQKEGQTEKIWIEDENGNRWIDSVLFEVLPFPDSLKSNAAIHAAGPGDGSFEIKAVDQTTLKHHLYVIRVIDSINTQGEKGISLKDSTDGRTLFLNHPLPDSLGHNMPVTDGFKILRGSIPLTRSYKDCTIGVSNIRRWTANGASGLRLEGLFGTIGNGFDRWYSGSTIGPDRLMSVQIRYADADGTWDPKADQSAQLNFSRAYRYLGHADSPAADPNFAPWIVNASPGFAYQDYNWGVPWAAYDITSEPQRRLMVGFLENNTTFGLVDGRSWPRAAGEYPSNTNNTDPTGPREWFFIFDVPYGMTPDPFLQVDILNTTVPLMWFGTPSRRSVNANYLYTDTLNILSYQPPTSRDAWIFHPDSLGIFAFPKTSLLPSVYALEQNYPNPFNPATQINYDLPFPSDVTLRIYDILGREVVTLVNEFQQAGRKTVRWESTSSGGYQVASGVYFYRLQAVNVSGNLKGDFLQTRKMMVIK